eukprot:Gregarina_sp_Poly_1__4136@NODE_2264_length_2382_cov_25_658747_g1452_i0_p1_GENE_NODE_2264_length_2382_cov_25_658747_g1452_i0NODE_2264_length_2382_cov_25_658747_g1452_i0_p1_ORF_typecomplete_len716_score109_47Herpes_env/PF01673_18/0_018Herpes_env/PF01673_18/2_8e03Laminin_I/PF06008_14/0_068Hemocyanin_M/PF00372_19/0_21_NODE_2264_length_2382_cov_25_658747_g1452_i0742221
MRSVQADRECFESVDLTLTKALICCETILYGNEAIAFECHSNKPPVKHLSICKDLEALKVKSHGSGFSWYPRKQIGFQPKENCVGAGLASTIESPGMEMKFYENDINQPLIDRMKLRGLTAKGSEKLFDDWQAFLRDKKLAERMIKVVGSVNDKNTVADVFLDYQLLLLRKKARGSFAIGGSEGPLVGNMQTFNNMFDVMFRRHNIAIRELSTSSRIQECFSKDNKNTELRNYFLEDLKRFYQKLEDLEDLSENIEDCVDSSFFVNEDGPQLESFIDSFNSAIPIIQDVMGWNTAPSILPLVRILYTNLLMADLLRRIRLSETFALCQDHQNISEDVYTIRSKQKECLRVIYSSLEFIFAKQVRRHKKNKEWNYKPKKLVVLLENAKKASVTKECVKCDLNKLEKYAKPLRISPLEEAVADCASTIKQLAIRRPQKKSADIQIDAIDEDEKFSCQEEHEAKTVPKFDPKRIALAREKLLHWVAHDLGSDSADHSARTNIFSQEELSRIQTWILTHDQLPRVAQFAETLGEICDDFEIPGICIKDLALKMEVTIPKILDNGLTFRETVAAMLTHYNTLLDSDLSRGNRALHEMFIELHRETLTSFQPSCPLRAARYRLLMRLPSLKSEATRKLLHKLAVSILNLNLEEKPKHKLYEPARRCLEQFALEDALYADPCMSENQALLSSWVDQQNGVSYNFGFPGVKPSEIRGIGFSVL